MTEDEITEDVVVEAGYDWRSGGMIAMRKAVILASVSE